MKFCNEGHSAIVVFENNSCPLCAMLEFHEKSQKTLNLSDSPAAPVQQTKVANCHIWEAGKQCEFVTGWECLDQCCAIPPISNRL